MSEQNEKNYLWILLLVVIVVAIAVVCWYFFFTKDVMYIYPATGQTENEVLGQAGDYIGGILNPLIGLVTVYLLYRTYVTQKKELKETTEAMKTQTEIANKQLMLSRDEHSRVQLIEIIRNEYSEFESLFKSIFAMPMNTPESDYLVFIFGDNSTFTLNQILYFIESEDSRGDHLEGSSYSDIINQKFIEYDPTQPETYFYPIWNQLFQVKLSIAKIRDITLDLIAVIHLKNIEKIWFGKYYDALVKAKDVGALSPVEFETMLREIQDARNEKN